MVLSGEINDGKTMIALLLARERLFRGYVWRPQRIMMKEGVVAVPIISLHLPLKGHKLFQ